MIGKLIYGVVILILTAFVVSCPALLYQVLTIFNCSTSKITVKKHTG